VTAAPEPGARPAAAQESAPPPFRLGRGGGAPVVRLGQPQSPFRDLYHRLLTMRWRSFLGLTAGLYLLANAGFAGLYLLGENPIANARPGSFADAFFFSVQTLATIGYGALYPRTLYANLLVTVESLLGMIAVATIAGIVFARVSRPTARVQFSRNAVVTVYDGMPTLMFRAANHRRNQILEAQVRVTLARNERTVEGFQMRRFYDLRLARSRSPLFALTWTIMHPIEPHSPLHGATRASLAADQAEIIVTLSGIDETFAQTVYARHSLVAEEIHWDARLADILTQTADGRRAVDYSRFDEIVPM
jgi:inward rectifier potassium channel